MEKEVVADDGKEGTGDRASSETKEVSERRELPGGHRNRWLPSVVYVVVAVLIGAALFFWDDVLVRSVPNFLREAAVLVAVFAILDRHLQHERLTVRYVVGVMLLGLVMLTAGDVVESRLLATDVARSYTPDASVPSAQPSSTR